MPSLCCEAKNPIHNMSDLSHTDDRGKARMVDVGDKPVTDRQAKAEAKLTVSPELFQKLQANALEKGDALTVARLAGIQAAKKTADLIPLCHPISITHIDIDIALHEPDQVQIESHVKATAVTGVEMEALTAAAAAALTIYDMGKSVDKGIVIENIRLLEKSGGKSGFWKRP
jgi:cyclic pyranopterin phosphate synthase